MTPEQEEKRAFNTKQREEEELRENEEWKAKWNKYREDKHDNIADQVVRFLYENKMESAACEKHLRGKIYLVTFKMVEVCKENKE